jgi:hypothetical protein
MIKVLRVGEPQRAGGRGNRRRCLPKQRAFDETKQMKHSEPSNVVRANFRFTANGVPIDDLMKRRCARLTSWPPRKDCRAMNLSVSLYRKFSPSLRSPDIFTRTKSCAGKLGKTDLPNPEGLRNAIRHIRPAAMSLDLIRRAELMFLTLESRVSRSARDGESFRGTVVPDTSRCANYKRTPRHGSGWDFSRHNRATLSPRPCGYH